LKLKNNEIVKREDIERKVKKEEKLGMPKGNGYKMECLEITFLPLCYHDFICELLNREIGIF
jgi:hypothetical protein